MCGILTIVMCLYNFVFLGLIFVVSSEHVEFFITVVSKINMSDANLTRHVAQTTIKNRIWFTALGETLSVEIQSYSFYENFNSRFMYQIFVDVKK